MRDRDAAGRKLIVYSVFRVHHAILKDFYLLVRDVVSAGQVRRDLDFKVVRPTLELVREHVPPGTNRMPPEPGDEPNLVETWM